MADGPFGRGEHILLCLTRPIINMRGDRVVRSLATVEKPRRHRNRFLGFFQTEHSTPAVYARPASVLFVSLRGSVKTPLRVPLHVTARMTH